MRNRYDFPEMQVGLAAARGADRISKPRYFGGRAKRPAMNRRRFLYSTTEVVACAGLAAAMWPFIDQMDPDAAVQAATEFPQYDLTGVRPRQLLTVRWHDIPVFVAVRTQAMLAAMQESAFVVQLVDPDSRASRQPAFAENFYRSRDPALAVLVGICPSCRCVPQYIAETSALGVVGGYACPCCATRYDPAGRAYYGLARFNLAVPPYDIVDGATLLVGKGGDSENFSVDSFERSS
jgi:ubiquinol-cytochrome c reductase iron-sulfur subunit